MRVISANLRIRALDVAELCGKLRGVRCGIAGSTVPESPVFGLVLPFFRRLRAACRIINEVRGVNRVVYDIRSDPPATIGWE